MGLHANDLTGVAMADLSAAAVALVVGGKLEVVGTARHHRVIAAAIAHGLGPGADGWLAPGAMDGEQVVFLVEALAEQSRRHPALRAALTEVVVAHDGAPHPLRDLGETCRHRQQHGAALGAYTSWLRLARAGRNPFQEAASLRQLGLLHSQLGAYSAAAACHRERRRLHLAAGEPTLAAEALVHLGMLHAEAGRSGRAISCLERAADELASTSGSEAASRAIAGIAAVRRAERQEEALGSAVDVGLQLLAADSEPALAAHLWREIARGHEESGRLEEAGQSYSASRRAMEAIGDRDGIVGLLRHLAHLRLLQGRPREAAAHFLDSLAAAGPPNRLERLFAVSREEKAATTAAMTLVAAVELEADHSHLEEAAVTTLARWLSGWRLAGAEAVL